MLMIFIGTGWVYHGLIATMLIPNYNAYSERVLFYRGELKVQKTRK